jgi:hypothetical protein
MDIHHFTKLPLLGFFIKVTQTNQNLETLFFSKTQQNKNSNLNCLVCFQMNPKVPTTRQFAHDAFFTMTASLQAAAVEIGLCWAWSNGYLPMRDYS